MAVGLTAAERGNAAPGGCFFIWKQLPFGIFSHAIEVVE
jgi:hypothetical protein